MAQTILVIILFLVAGFFLGRRFYLSFSGKGNSGCESCAAKEIAER
ncbi:MAG: hypothetical protein JXR10_12415 [Cyclobacteriaceae bacterium]